MKRLNICLLALGLSILAACGGGGGSAGSGTTVQGSISGTVTKGPISTATVTAYAISSGQMGAQIATTTTDANGNFTMGTGTYAGPMMLQVSGGTYSDEATGTSMTMAPGDVITAVMPTIAAGTMTSSVQVTPMTAMAQTMAQHLTGGMTDANIATANVAIGVYFTVSDILHTQPMNPLVSGSGTSASTDAQNYGMALAAISQAAHTQGMGTSSAMVTALMNDASDGIMDGKAGNAAVQMGGMAGGMMLPTNAGTSGLGAAMNAFMASSQNKSGITTTTLMNKLNAANGQMIGSGPVMVNAMVSGTVFNGLVNKATVKAFAINNGVMGAQIASVATDGQGNFTMPLGSYAGPVLLQMNGGTYSDEATGTAMDMAASDVMSAVLPTVASGANVTGIQVTPVTSMAQTRALAMSGGMSDTNIDAANTAMGNYFSVTDILHTQPMNPTFSSSGAGATTDMRNYGLTLAAMSQSAKTLNMAVSTALVTAMMSDASDGLMDGKRGASAISMSMGGMMGGMSSMASTTGTSGLATAMTGFLNSVANASGLTPSDMTALIHKLTGSNGQI
jgi:hypothetical protein